MREHKKNRLRRTYMQRVKQMVAGFSNISSGGRQVRSSLKQASEVNGGTLIDTAMGYQNAEDILNAFRRTDVPFFALMEHSFRMSV